MTYVYVLVGKQKIAKDVKIANIEIDSKTGKLLTQFFEEEQVGTLLDHFEIILFGPAVLDSLTFLADIADQEQRHCA